MSHQAYVPPSNVIGVYASGTHKNIVAVIPDAVIAANSNIPWKHAQSSMPPIPSAFFANYLILPLTAAAANGQLKRK